MKSEVEREGEERERDTGRKWEKKERERVIGTDKEEGEGEETTYERVLSKPSLSS